MQKTRDDDGKITDKVIESHKNSVEKVVYKDSAAKKPDIVPAHDAQTPPKERTVLSADAPKEKKDEAIRYTLQLSAFQDKAEAEEFMQKLQANGESPYLVPTQIPERGLWYRVRVGNYQNWEEAVNAKERFEREQQVIAYVAKK